MQPNKETSHDTHSENAEGEVIVNSGFTALQTFQGNEVKQKENQTYH